MISSRAHNNKSVHRARRHARIRARVGGTAARPRLSIFRSNRFISVQLIDDTAGTTLAAAHGRNASGPAAAQAKTIGERIATEAKKQGITHIVFDRGGYRYAGQVKTLAEAARAGGLIF